MCNYRGWFRILGIVGFLLSLWSASAIAESVARMDSDELRDRLGEANLVVLDVRRGGDFDQSEARIAGAVRVDPNDTLSWAGSFDKSSTIVLYCA